MTDPGHSNPDGHNAAPPHGSAPYGPGPYEPPTVGQRGFFPPPEQLPPSAPQGAQPPGQPASPRPPTGPGASPYPQHGQFAPAPPFPGYYPPPPGPPPVPGPGYGSQLSAPVGMYFDRASELMLPNGTVLASHGRRFGAWAMMVATLVIISVCTGIFLPLGIVLWLAYLVWGVVAWTRGTTPMLSLLRMRVWRPGDGRPAEFGPMLLREVVGYIVYSVSLGIASLVSFIMFLATRQRRALHDMIGGSVVLSDPNGVLTR